ncbi:MAG: hypothetical protein WBD41_27865 [Rhodococcus sp. (in: high G+C Gram-positive bacteria)]|jgi:hypothetical protein
MPKRNIRPIDDARAARVVLGLFDNDMDVLNRALDEANRECGIVLLIAALAKMAGQTMMTMMSEEDARSVLQRSILDVQAAGEAGR